FIPVSVAKEPDGRDGGDIWVVVEAVAPVEIHGSECNQKLRAHGRQPLSYGLRRYALASSSTRTTHTPEKPACFNSGSLCPFVHQARDPNRDGNGSDVTGFSTQVHNCPMPLALLQVPERQLDEFMATESTGQQDGKQRSIAFALHPLPVWCLPQCLP